jgi:hypothetical protein
MAAMATVSGHLLVNLFDNTEYLPAGSTWIPARTAIYVSVNFPAGRV